MRKNVFGRQLKRDSNERKALFKNLLSSLVIYERIQTSEAKAKAIKAGADKLITKAKKGGLHAYRMLEPDLTSGVAKKLLETIAPRFMNRNGGYTRIIRVGRRLKDNSQEVILEWTVQAAPKQSKNDENISKTPAKETKKESTNPISKIANKLVKKSGAKKEMKGKSK